MIIEYGPWTADVDCVATSTLYQRRTESGTDRCACSECRNFATLRRQAYPQVVRELFSKIGVDFQKETEVHHYGRLPCGLHVYRGWFQVVGRLKDGPDAWVRTGGEYWQRHFHRSSPAFEMGLHEKCNAPDCPSDFAGVRYVELDFYVLLPWKIDEPEPLRIAEGYQSMNERLPDSRT